MRRWRLPNRVATCRRPARRNRVSDEVIIDRAHKDKTRRTRSERRCRRTTGGLTRDPHKPRPPENAQVRHVGRDVAAISSSEIRRRRLPRTTGGGSLRAAVDIARRPAVVAGASGCLRAIVDEPATRGRTVTLAIVACPRPQLCRALGIAAAACPAWIAGRSR